MWLQTTLGFFSIQQEHIDRDSGMLTVSAYCLDDLQAFVSKLMPGCVIQYGDENQSHKYFIRAPQARIGAAIAQAVSDICYRDLTNAVRLSEGDIRTKCLMGIEHQLSEIQHYQREYHFDASTAKDSEPEKILEVGCEGGAYTLWRCQYCGQNVFIVASNDCSGLWIDEDTSFQEKAFYSWDEAVRNLPEHWASLFPLYVAPDYSGLIKNELRMRGVDVTQENDWKYVLDDPKRNS
ncbi:hypothetical protein [Methylomicrobium sp. Wu6]|uniref:hypothetical protein n=1 Tax=Methylomicrobium sp. Wu6 TaxID=3107928 RepID=UPI002DD68C98|nr:hypothetical protein [Methylomicrobium sp. Wu6]MEC4747163.1 hypothetical protein [Methylomicrobium sp. Wu6]